MVAKKQNKALGSESCTSGLKEIGQEKTSQSFRLEARSPKRGRGNAERGQAAIEMALSLPFLIWLIFYTINGFYTLHTAHVAQKYAAMNLWQRVNNRSKFVMDDVATQLHNREFMAVRYTEPDGTLPRRRINAGSIPVFNIVGVCREPGCTR